MNPTRRRRLRRASGIVAVFAALATLLAACGGSPSGAKASSADAASWQKTAYLAPDQAKLKEVAAKVLNGNADVNALAPEIQQAMMLASEPLTEAQRQTLKTCLAKDSCETGQGKYTLAIVDDQVNTWYSMARAEVTSVAIKSGAVAKIIHFSSNLNVQQYLADWRSAIGQGADMIVSQYGALGNQAGPAIAQAKAKGIPVVNGCCMFSPEVMSKLSTVTEASMCDMWKNGGAKDVAAHLKSKGIGNPTFALFTGPAGNSFAATWQPCVKEALQAEGMKGVYDGTTDWTPQGTVKAAAALQASGKKPSVIVYDTYAEDFIHAYEDAGIKDLPMFVLTASSTVGTAKAYKDALAKGFKADIWVAPSNVWTVNLAFMTELSLKDGKKASSNPIQYPMKLTDLKDVIGSIDLNINQAAFLGSTLDAQDQNESLKH